MITIVCHCGDNIGIPSGAETDQDDWRIYHGDDDGRPTACPLDDEGEMRG